VLLSIGMAVLSKIPEMVETVLATGDDQIVLFQCTSKPSALTDKANIASFKFLDTIIGKEATLNITKYCAISFKVI